MKISIIVTAYNIERYIEKCLLSLINQTYKNLEIIVVNDGSTDNTYNIIKKYELNDKRILSISEVNQGVQAARYTGFKKASGEYFLIIDGDDFLELNCIENLVECVSNFSYDIVYYNINIVNKDKIVKCIAQVNYNNTNESDFVKTYMTSEKMQNGLYCKFIKREYVLINNIEFLNNNYSMGEDLLSTIILGMYNPKVYYLDKCLYNYVKREGSATNTYKNVFQVFEIFNYIENNMPQLINRYKEEYIFFMFCQTYLTYCIKGKDYNIKRKYYLWWKNNNIDIKKILFIRIKANYMIMEF